MSATSYYLAWHSSLVHTCTDHSTLAERASAEAQGHQARRGVRGGAAEAGANAGQGQPRQQVGRLRAYEHAARDRQQDLVAGQHDGGDVASNAGFSHPETDRAGGAELTPTPRSGRRGSFESWCAQYRRSSKSRSASWKKAYPALPRPARRPPGARAVARAARARPAERTRPAEKAKPRRHLRLVEAKVGARARPGAKAKSHHLRH